MSKNIKTSLKDFLNEQVNSLKPNDIESLFDKFQKELETSEDKYSKIGLKESLELIGSGEITETSSHGDKYMYKEMLNNDTIIFVVHASISHPVINYGYRYDIGVYKNDPQSHQWGGGYGASGIMSVEHTNLVRYDTYDKVYQNKEIISRVCQEIIEYIKNNL